MATFWEKPRPSFLQVPPEIPSISEIVIALDQLDLLSLGQSQFIRAASFEVVCS